MTEEVVAVASSGIKRKNSSMEDKAAALQQKGMEMQQEADHTRACLIVKYSAAQKKGFINMGLWNRSEQELRLAHQYANEGVENCQS